MRTIAGFSAARQASTFFAVLCGVLAFSAVSAIGGDWPQYRGPSSDGKTSEKVSKWPDQGPRQVWKQPMSDGFSSFTVSGGKAFTLVTRPIEGVVRELCVGLNAETGAELWAVPLCVSKYDGGGDSGTDSNKGGDGARSTPSVDGGMVYALDSRLVLTAMEAATGKVAWTVDIMKDHGGQKLTWQNAASPVIDGDLVFVAGGGSEQSLLGIHKRDGKVVWKGESEKMTHATPTLATIHGVRQVIFFTQSGLVSKGTLDGRTLWKAPFKYNVSTAASPIVGGDMVYCSAGYGMGAGAFKIAKEGEKFTATEAWRQTGNKLANHWSTPVCKDGYLYGMFSFKEYGDGAFKCVEMATGKEVWSKPGFGPGNVILSGNYLVALGDAGQLVLIHADPKEYSEAARAQILSGKCWSTPVLSNGRIYARSTKEGVCLDVSEKMAQH